MFSQSPQAIHDADIRMSIHHAIVASGLTLKDIAARADENYTTLWNEIYRPHYAPHTRTPFVVWYGLGRPVHYEPLNVINAKFGCYPAPLVRFRRRPDSVRKLRKHLVDILSLDDSLERELKGQALQRALAILGMAVPEIVAWQDALRRRAA